jgi:hypothetical protein
MPSPFPGMDPYLENPARWAGTHTRLIVAIQTQLNHVLPDDLVADIDEYVWVTEEGDDGEVPGKPDVFLPHSDYEYRPVEYPSDPSVVTAPSLTVTLPANKLRKNRAVKIMTTDGSRVLTVVEVLSPSNKKRGEDREAYLGKRRTYFAAQANVVEIDLLRDGDRLPMGRPSPPSAHYHVLVTRAGEYPTGRVWSFSVREPIPTVPVPLDPTTPAVPLDLRACLADVYENARMGKKIDYGHLAVPPLSRADAERVADLLKKHAKKK